MANLNIDKLRLDMTSGEMLQLAEDLIECARNSIKHDIHGNMVTFICGTETLTQVRPHSFILIVNVPEKNNVG
jgi:hypothetical protein